MASEGATDAPFPGLGDSALAVFGARPFLGSAIGDLPTGDKSVNCVFFDGADGGLADFPPFEGEG